MIDKSAEPSVPISTQPAAEIEPKLLAKVGEGLDDLFGDGAEDEGGERGKRIVPKGDTAPETEPKSEDEELEDDDGTKAEDKEESEPDDLKLESEEGDDDYDIPEAYLRAAEEHQWKREDIVKMFKSNGSEATDRFLKNLYAKSNQQSSWFADAGRRMKQLEEQYNGGGQSNVHAPQGAPTPLPGISPEDLAAYETEHGANDPLIRGYKQQSEMIGNLNGQLSDVNKRLSSHDADMLQLESDRKTNEARHTADFFRTDSVKQYDMLYGTLPEGTMSFEGLPIAQKMNRDKVMELAGNIMLGAEFHGKDVTLDSALDMAHRVVSEPMAAVVARESLIKSVNRRSKARIVRPSDSIRTGNSTRSTGKPKTHEELVAKTARALAKVFG